MTEKSSITSAAPVVKVEVFEIEAAFATPYKLSHGTLATTRAVLLKLTDADGVEGWGEANPDRTFSGESSGDEMRALKETLLPAVLCLRGARAGLHRRRA